MLIVLCSMLQSSEEKREVLEGMRIPLILDSV